MTEQRNADEIFKEFKEHSIAEFFKKNRQMLGYSGMVRSLVTVVHEYTTNSVTYETPTVVMVNGEIKIVEIGELANDLFKQYNENIIGEGVVESLRNLREEIKVLCFDKTSLKMKFKELKSIHRHRLDKTEKLYKVIMDGGRNVEVTRYHNLFTLIDGNITPVKADRLQVRQNIIVPTKNWLGRKNIQTINLIEQFLSFPPYETKGINIYGVKTLLYSNKKLMHDVKSVLSTKDKNYTFYSYYMKCDRLPINLIRHLSKEQQALFYNCRIASTHSALIDNFIKIDEDLMKFLGLFTAEGSIRRSLYEISLSFGAHEKELINITSDLITKIFKITPTVRNAHPTAINVTVRSKTIAILLSKIFGYGFSAKEKTIPDLVFNLDEKLATIFLISYLCGDGYPTSEFTRILINNGAISEISKKITVATASKKLMNRLMYLLSVLGYSYSFSEHAPQNRVINGISANFGTTYWVEFWPLQKQSYLHFYPIESLSMTNIKDPKVLWGINNKNQKTVMIEKLSASRSYTLPDVVERFIAGDLRVLRIKEIKERFALEGEFVYDYSVDGDENFVGGFGPICLHNSLDAAEEAHILPDVDIDVSELGDNKYKVKVTDNGPGIPKKFIGKALATILAGTKFHRYVQQRGQQGIGAAGCTLFSQITTGKPILARSGTGKETYACELSIDTMKNTPIVKNLVDIDEEFKGLSVVGEFADVKYENSDHGVYEYLKRTALSNPHSQIKFKDPEGKEYVFMRSVKEIPQKSRPIQPHPLGLSVNDLLEFAHSSQSRKISSFLVETFARTTSNKVSELKEIAKTINFDKSPKELNWEDSEELIKAIRSIKWITPDASSIIPIGEHRIKLALKNILNPEFMNVVERKPCIFRGGVPFVVEAAVAYGGNSGKKEEDGYSGTILRFANRVPLLFDSASCAISRSVNDIDWKRYNIDMETQPVSVFVNVSSVYIPYSGVGKEAISQEAEIMDEIKLAVMEAARGVQRYVRGKAQVAFNVNRYKAIARYVKQLSSDIGDLTGSDKKRIETKLDTIITKHFPNMKEEKGDDYAEEKDEITEEES